MPQEEGSHCDGVATKRFTKGSLSAVDIEELASTEASSHLAPKSVERMGNSRARDVLRKLKKRANTQARGLRLPCSALGLQSSGAHRGG